MRAGKSWLMGLVMVSMLAPAAAHANLITNGDFEDVTGGTVVVTGGGYIIYSSIPGWYSTTPGPGGIEVQFNGVAGSPLSGNKLVELDSNLNSNMFQDVATLAGQWHTLSFYFSPRPTYAAETNGIDILWNGVVIDTITGVGASNTVWGLHTYSVFGDGSDQLGFQAGGTSDSLGGYLENVSLEAVPEPGTLLLLGSGLAGLALLRRRRQS